MKETINNIRRYLNKCDLDAVLVNSTNEFLEEYTPLAENARYALTNFSGSTGDVVVTAEKVYLFVDGRYHIQADMEVDHDLVTVVKLQTGETMLSVMQKLLPTKAKLAVDTKKNSVLRVEKLTELFEVFPLEENLINLKLQHVKNKIEQIDTAFTGLSSEEKLKSITKDMAEEETLLVTNPEEVSYLFNLRDFSKPYTSKIRAKAVVKKTGSKYFFDLAEFDRVLLNLNGRIFADKSTLTQFEYDLIKNNEITFEQSPVQKMKSVKTEKEIEHYKKAFERTDLAVSAIRDYIENNENISEFDIAENLEMFYKKFGAKSLSFKSIVAKDKNSALAHYSKCSKDEIIKDGSLILIDCGAYYEGGLATDITRVFVKGQPSALQKKVYTTVLKMFLHSFNYPVCEGTTGYEIDNLARKIADKNQIEGFEFNHGLGHGIGVSVHEYPPNLSKNELAKIKLENNMCFTIEPGLYNKKHFGVRLENSCYMKDGKIHSFVKMNYEKKLIEFDMLTEQERIWLDEFEVK